jgi:hypothetical protein
MLLTYFLNDFEIVPLAPIITGITLVFTFHMRCISIVRTLYTTTTTTTTTNNNNNNNNETKSVLSK